MCYQAIYSLGNAGRGAGGFIGDENDLALACATVFPFVYMGMQYSQRRVVCLLLAAIYAAAIVVSFSRGGFLGLLAGVLYCVMMGTHRARNLAIGLVAAGIFFVSLPAEYKAELGTIQETDSGTSEVRFFLWRAATNMWKDNPILGVGVGNSPWQIGRYQPRGVEGKLFNRPMYLERDWSGTVVHSLYFELLAETGLVGCGIFLAIVYGHFVCLWRLRRDVARDARASPALRRTVDLYATALGGAAVAYLAAAAFLAVLYYPYLWYFSAMAVALDRWVRAELAAGAPAAAN
jgi:O-antigen ligase